MQPSFVKRLRWPAVVSAACAGTVGAVMAYVAIQHNPQEAYCVHRAARDACAIRWGPVAELVASWFVPSLALALLVSASVSEALRIVVTDLRRG